jgi:hypothetical protein
MESISYGQGNELFSGNCKRPPPGTSFFEPAWPAWFWYDRWEMALKKLHDFVMFVLNSNNALEIS